MSLLMKALEKAAKDREGSDASATAGVTKDAMSLEPIPARPAPAPREAAAAAPTAPAAPSRTGGALKYRLVAQIEHSGGLEGGHYWARCLRGGGALQAFMLNDTGISPARFGPSAETYIVVYHFY